MQIKKLLAPMFAPLVLSAAFGLMACGDDSSAAPANPVVDPSTDPSLIPTDPSTNPSVNPTDPSTNPTVTPTDPTPTTPEVVDPTAPWTPTVALASTANTAYPATVYQAWKPFHFVTFEEESVYYADIAQDYADIFLPEFLPAGRVIWSSQTTGYYAKQCQDKNSTVSGMKARGCTVSEGTGYGMLLTYFNGDEDAFIRLWNYSRAYRSYNSTSTVPSYLTPWITFSFHYNEIDNSSATDADLDIATSLVLMYYKTLNQAYLADALNIIGAIWDHEVNKTSLLLLSGDTPMWDGSTGPIVYNLSYFSPVALRLFAMVDPNHNWTGVLDAMYNYMATVQAAGTGVFPDWSDAAGAAAKPANGSADNTYWTFNKESVRIPWRIAWDYYWFQDPRALSVLTTLNTFIVGKSGGDPASAALAINYSWDPAKKDANTATVPAHWLSAWCATGLGNNPTWLESCTPLVNAKVPSNSGSSYFTDILLGMYSALLNGAFVRPF